MLAFLVDVQRAIHEALAGSIGAFATSRDWGALIAVLPFALIFGAAHALTPGHSKMLLATYVAGSGANAAKAALTAVALAGTHIASAVLVAGVAGWLVSRTITDAGQAPATVLLSRTILVGIGLWLVARALLRLPHPHGEGLAVGLIAGLVPCPLTLFLTFYAGSRGVPEAGLLFAGAILVGVCVVLVCVALTGVVARGALVWVSSHLGASAAMLSRAVDLIAGALLIVIAVAELVA
jgi:nickel/cobalt transporter (NicO) family protein